MVKIKRLDGRIFKRRISREVERASTTHPNAPAPIIDEFIRYEVEKVLNSRPSDVGIMYLVKWTGYDDEFNSWISELPQFFQKNKALYTNDKETGSDD